MTSHFAQCNQLSQFENEVILAIGAMIGAKGPVVISDFAQKLLVFTKKICDTATEKIVSHGRTKAGLGSDLFCCLIWK